MRYIEKKFSEENTNFGLWKSKKDNFEHWKSIEKETIDTKCNDDNISIDKVWRMIDSTYENEEGVKIFPKKELQKSLLIEQGYICCYCGQRISEEGDNDNQIDKVVIEHFLPKSKNRDKVFDYSNLIASCQGNKQEEYYVNIISKNGKYVVEKIEDIASKCNTTVERLKELNKGKHLDDRLGKGDKIIIDVPPKHCDNLKEDNITPIINPVKDQDCAEKFRYENDGTISPAEHLLEKEITLVNDTISVLGLNIPKLKEERQKRLKAAKEILPILNINNPIELKKQISKLVDAKNKPNIEGELLAFCFVEIYFLKTLLK